MIRLAPNSNTNVIRFIPMTRLASTPATPYTFIVRDEELNEFKLFTISPLTYTQDGVVQVISPNGLFTTANNGHYGMMYVYSKPFGATITLDNYQQWGLYMVWSGKVYWTTDTFSYRTSLNGNYQAGLDKYNDYPYESANNDFVIL